MSLKAMKEDRRCCIVQVRNEREGLGGERSKREK